MIDPFLLPGSCESHLCSAGVSQLFSFLKLLLGDLHLYIGYLGNVSTEFIFSFFNHPDSSLAISLRAVALHLPAASV